MLSKYLYTTCLRTRLIHLAVCCGLQDFSERRHLVRLWLSTRPELSLDLETSAYENSLCECS